MNQQTEMNYNREEAYSLMTDPEVRRMCRQDPKAALNELKSRGHAVVDLDGVDEVNVVFNTADTMYIPMPQIEAGYSLSDDNLEQLSAGAGSASTAGCASTASTVGTANTTLSSAGSAGSLSSAGSTGSN